MEFNNYEKKVLDLFFTSSNPSDTIYAAKANLPDIIVAYLIGRASRAPKTFREIFLDMWKDVEKTENEDNLKGISITENSLVIKLMRKSEDFITKWKVHNSLRDIPHVSVFCDNLSILQTKVWEYEPVAEYQEKSTRYRPFSADNTLLPNIENNELISEIKSFQESAVKLYNDIMEDTNKRDIARYLLPVGSLTAMGCTASIRSWERILGRMRVYPTLESYKMAHIIKTHIEQVVPSFDPNDTIKNSNGDMFNFLRDRPEEVIKGPADQASGLVYIDDIIRINGLIDIGAHRDLQRHRSIIQGHHDYRAFYGHDGYMPQNFLNEDLSNKYHDIMDRGSDLFMRVFEDIKSQKEYIDKNTIGESQYITLLGHMTPFYYITNEERWDYVYKLRTGHPSQSATNPKTVHFSYSKWCSDVQNKIDIMKTKNNGS